MTPKVEGTDNSPAPETEEEKHVKAVVDSKLNQFAEEFNATELEKADKDLETMLDRTKGKKKK